MEFLSAIEQMIRMPVTDPQIGFLSPGATYRRDIPSSRKDSETRSYYVLEPCDDGFRLSTSYFIGLDWVTPDVAIHVAPKLNSAHGTIDYLKMLVDALTEPDNARHLDGLINIDFNARQIKLEQKEDILSPFIVAQFVLVLKNAIRKGLRKSYYLVQENLKSKVKGKILINQNIQKNLTKGNITDNICQYQEYGLDNPENRVLKAAIELSSRILSTYQGGMDLKELKRAIATMKPYFKDVSDEYSLANVQSSGKNPIFKEYYQSLEYAVLIIRRASYGIDLSHGKFQATPPYWIDMSKLFELYVFKKLKEAYPDGFLKYHEHIFYRELDYLLRPAEGEPMVIDAKYKPAYHYSIPSIDDIRQVSGYSRMAQVYEKLHLDDTSRLIRCLIVYANQDCPDSLDPTANVPQALKEYVNFYKVGIRLPERT